MKGALSTLDPFSTFAFAALRKKLCTATLPIHVYNALGLE